MIEPAHPWDEGLPTIEEQGARETEWLAAHAHEPVAVNISEDMPKWLAMPGWQAVDVVEGGKKSLRLIPAALGQVFPILLDPRTAVDLTDVLDRLWRWEFPDYPVISPDEFEARIPSKAARMRLETPWSYKHDEDPMLNDLDLIRLAGGVFGKVLTRESSYILTAKHGHLSVHYDTWKELDLPDLTSPLNLAEISSNEVVRELHQAAETYQRALRDPRTSAEDREAAKALNAEASAAHEAAHEAWRVAQRVELDERNRLRDTLLAEVRRMIRCASEKALIADPWKASLVH